VSRAGWVVLAVLGACGGPAEVLLGEPPPKPPEVGQDASGAPQGEPGPEGGVTLPRDAASEPWEGLDGAMVAPEPQAEAGAPGVGAGGRDAGPGDAQVDVRQALGAGGAPGAGGASGVGGATCVYEGDVRFCMRLGKQCGGATGIDNCGNWHAAPYCGSCTLPSTCGAVGIPGWCGCMPESDATLCVRYGTNCGILTGVDNCNTSRTVASCGVCLSNQTCMPLTPGVLKTLVCVYGR
jgi:hypothetical protein